jgi:tRNA threonylcarbamoyladenosine biosynthesis protein TsaE
VAQIVQQLDDEAATVAFGAWLAEQIITRLRGNAVVFLAGQLGAGKTTLVRGLLQALGHSGAVKSPTYTLLEPYSVNGHDVYHFDLYRVNDPQELEFVGFDEIVDGPGIKLFEWAEKAAGWLPAPDVQVVLSINEKTDPVSREVSVAFA